LTELGEQRRQLEVTPMRAAIARRMSASNRDIPQFNVSNRIDMTEPVARVEATASSQGKLTITALLVHATVAALREHPILNSRWDADAVYTHDRVNLSIAVAVPGGLLAPAILRADDLSPLQIARSLSDLVGRARTQKLKPDELTAGTFTLSNLGGFDVSGFTALVTPPQIAVLATSSIEKYPIFNHGLWQSRAMMNATLTADHRVVDGVDAARFLTSLKQHLEARP
jgi:pyruvate dehydrogenase E2 component (dihydrolipoyllysine-residue acetyltransferase)